MLSLQVNLYASTHVLDNCASFCFFTASRYILVAEDSKYTFSKDHSAYVCMCMHACGYIDIINSHFIHHPGALWMSSLMQCTAWICIDC